MKTLGSVALLMFACLIASPAVAGDREYWRHSRGHFENTVGNTWVEKSPDGEFHFVERDRTDASIVLYDQSRDCTVRLTNNQCWVKAPFTQNQFRKFYDGKWGSE